MFRLKLFTPLTIAALLYIAAAAPAMAQQAYAYQNVFDDDTDLTLTGMWAVDNTPAVANASPPAAGNSLNYNDGVDYDNGGSNTGTARTPVIDMTGVSAATMSFWCRYQTETTSTPYDQRWIRIYNATSGAQVYNQQFYGTAPAPLTCPAMNQWHQHTWDPFPGVALDMPIIIEFYFNTQDSIGNNYQGWFIDDMEIIADDAQPPAVIADLAASDPTLDGCTLGWSSPFDNDISGVAASFDLRFATAPITDGNFGSATTVTGEPQPSVPGTQHTVSLTGLNPDTVYYFAIRTTDFANNVSSISNVPTLATLPLPVVGGSATSSAAPVKDRYANCGAGVAGAPFGLMVLAGLMSLGAGIRRFSKR